MDATSFSIVIAHPLSVKCILSWSPSTRRRLQFIEFGHLCYNEQPMVWGSESPHKGAGGKPRVRFGRQARGGGAWASGQATLPTSHWSAGCSRRWCPRVTGMFFVSLFFNTVRRGPRSVGPPPREFAHWGCEDRIGAVGQTPTESPAFQPQHPNTRTHNVPRRLRLGAPYDLGLKLCLSG